MRRLIVFVLVAGGLGSVTNAQKAEVAATEVMPVAIDAAVLSPSAAIVASQCCEISALTPVSIEFLTTINSQVNKIGETFPIRLSSPILIGESVIVPAGALGSGDIVHASKSSFGGKPGELVLAVRWLDHDGIKIPLRSLKYMTTSKPGQGKDNTNTAAAVGVAVGVVAMFITGGEVNIPAGTVAFAKTAAPVTITPPSN